MGKLSIITINYNNANGLKRTFESVMSQSYTDYEYIVVDGGSTDGSLELIEEYSNDIDKWCSEKDFGIYNAMNKGIRMAVGDYVLFLNSGDCLYNPEVLTAIVSHLCGEDIIYGDLFLMDTNGKGNMYVYPDTLTMEYFLHNTLGHPASFIKRELFCNSFYSESFKIVSDWEFFLKKIVIESCTYKHVEQTISVFYLDGISSRCIDLCNIEKSQVLKKMFPTLIYNYFTEAENMRQQYQTFKDNTLFDIFQKLGKTRRFQKRIRPLLIFLYRVNRLFSR